MKLTPAMIRLLPEHARRKYFDTDKTNMQKNYDVDKESQISETTETLESNERKTPTPPPPPVPLTGIQAQLQERLRAISEKIKAFKLKAMLLEISISIRKMTLDNLVGPQMVSFRT